MAVSDTHQRIAVIAEIVKKKKKDIGKLAMMKDLFILQQVYKVPLGYDFEIYTYGPYTSEVMEDMDTAEMFGVISIETTLYPNGKRGYKLHLEKNAAEEIEEHQAFLSKYEKDIDKVMELFGSKTAKELELSSTIIYLYDNYKKNHWECTKDTISKNVYEVKPHFSIEEIEGEYENLNRLGLLEKAAS